MWPAADTPAGRRPIPAALLRRLRMRLTALFAAITAAGLTALVILLVLANTSAMNDRLDEQLQATASRAAALVYVDADGTPQVDAVRDDLVTERAAQRLVVLRTGADDTVRVAFDPSRVGVGAVRDVAELAFADEEESGTLVDATSAGTPVRLAAMPWFDGDRVAGAVVVIDDRARAADAPVLWPAALGSLLLLALLTVTMWTLTGRGLRPAFAAIDDREHFLAAAAHELRRPLARLRATADAARTDDQTPHREQLRQMVGIADDAGLVISNLLLATRIDHAQIPVRRELVRLDQLLGDLELAVDGLVVEFFEPITVTGDLGLLRQAMGNLIDNANKHGRSPVRAAASILDGRPVVEVTDDGPGFPPGVDVAQRYVIGPRGGTGLGLSLVAWIAEAHGAELDLGAGNDEAGGARVKIVFPDPRPGRADGLNLSS